MNEFPTLDAACAEIERLRGLVNTPLNRDWLAGVVREAAHQIERWGEPHDRAKEPADWFWLVGYLAGKALRAHVDGADDKAMHHTISTAAALLNWHTHIAGVPTGFTPGDSDIQKLVEAAFGAVE